MKKNLIPFIFLLSLMTAACSQSKTESDPIPTKVEEVNKPLSVKVEVVCIDRVTKDGKPVFEKDGKRAQDCKTMKVREKLQTKPPERK